MNIWSSREKSLVWLNNILQQESKVLQEGFDYLETIMELFQRISNDEGKSQIGQFCRICIVTLAKFSRLLLGCYSLVLDSLVQESGALLRLVIETYELLVYFRLDISRINEILEDKLPSAGIIAKKISGDFQDLRNYLNNNASHFSYRLESVRHLYGPNAKTIQSPLPSPKALRKNLSLIYSFQVFMLIEAVNCLFAVGFNANSIRDEMEKWREKSEKIFAAEK